MLQNAGRAAAQALALGLTFVSTSAKTEEEPFVEGRIVFRIEAKEIYKSDDPDELGRDVYPRINSSLTFHLGHGFEFFNIIDMKPYEKLEDGEERYFQDVGVLVESIGLRYRGDGWMVEAGKIHPVFGSAYDTAPGFFGDDFGKDYEIEHQWGVGFAAELFHDTALLGNGVLSGSLFMVDRTALDGTLFAERHITRYEEGGPGNTDWPQSFTIALEGGDGYLTPGFGYHLGFVHRAPGEGDKGSEWGFALGASQKVELDEDWGLYFMGEVAYFHDWEASLDDRTYATLGAEVSWKGFFASGTVAGIMVDADDGDDYTDHILTFDVGHEWRIGKSRLSLSAAWETLEEDGVNSDGYGLRLRYRLPI